MLFDARRRAFSDLVIDGDLRVHVFGISRISDLRFGRRGQPAFERGCRLRITNRRSGLQDIVSGRADCAARIAALTWTADMGPDMG